MDRPTVLTDPTGHHCADEDINGLCPEDPGYDSGGISITPSSCPTCYHTVGQNSQSNQLDPLRELSALTGITPQSACAILLGSSSNPLCDSRTYNLNNYSIGSPGISMLTSGQTTTGLNLVSQTAGFTDAMKWTKWPIVSIVVDASAQWNEDNGNGYNGVQQVVRAGVRAGEGQLASTAGVALAGADSIPGAITGPGDVIIIGGSYLIGSNATSFWLDVANNTVARYAPPAFGVYFPQTLLPSFDRSAPGNIDWCYSTIYGGC